MCVFFAASETWEEKMGRYKSGGRNGSTRSLRVCVWDRNSQLTRKQTRQKTNKHFEEETQYIARLQKATPRK